MPIQFVHRQACPLCRSKTARQLCDLAFDRAPLAPFLQGFYGGRLNPGLLSGGRYQVLYCRGCDFIYQDPILDNDAMLLLYQEWVDQVASLDKKKNMGASRCRQYAGQLRTLQRLFSKPPAQVRVLDYGMGWGYWCQMARAAGFDVAGYELSAERAQHARQLGIRVIDQLGRGAGKYDFIYANQVFEHLPEPLEVLRELCACLHADGIVYLRVPDGRNVVKRLQGHGWKPELDAIHPLEHINCFTRGTLIKLAAAAGLRLLQPPLRLSWGSLHSSIRREISDRWLTTHLMFRR